jgi:hypothetical protein
MPSATPVRLLLCSAALAFGLPDLAAAQDPAPPKGTVGGQAAASGGATELDDGKFAGASTSEPMDATEAEINAGGLFTSGNARAGAFTGGGRVRVRRKIHEFSASLIGNYAQAGIRQADGSIKGQTTVGNVQGRVRYDVFFHPRVSFFTMVTVRHDPFLGLDARMRIDPGFAFYIINKPKHRLWAEAGYDFLLDVRRIKEGADPTLCAPGNAYVLDIPNTDPTMPRCAARPRVATHSGRLFAGYTNSLSDRVVFATGLEYIQAFAPFRTLPEESENNVERIKAWVNWDVSLTTSLTKHFAFATTFTLRYDNGALPGVKRLDTITAFNLVYRFF